MKTHCGLFVGAPSSVMWSPGQSPRWVRSLCRSHDVLRGRVQGLRDERREGVALHLQRALRLRRVVRVSFRPSVGLSVWLSVCLSVRPSVWLSVCLSVHLCLSVCLPVRLSCLSACLPACLSVCPSACLSVYVHLPVCLSVCSVGRPGIMTQAAVPKLWRAESNLFSVCKFCRNVRSRTCH